MCRTDCWNGATAVCRTVGIGDCVTGWFGRLLEWCACGVSEWWNWLWCDWMVWTDCWNGVTAVCRTGGIGYGVTGWFGWTVGMV